MTEPTAADDGQAVLAIVLDKPTRAEQVLLALAHLQGEGKVRMFDAVIVAKDAAGNARTIETVDVTPAKGAIKGGWFGVLASLLVGGPVGLGLMVGGVAAGALYGKLVDHGLEDDWVKGMADWIDPDTSALLLLVGRDVHPDLLAELRRFEGAGEVAYSTLPEAVQAEIEAALSGHDREVLPDV